MQFSQPEQVSFMGPALVSQPEQVERRVAARLPVDERTHIYIIHLHHRNLNYSLRAIMIGTDLN